MPLPYLRDGPAVEPVTVPELRAFLRLGGETAEDTLLENLVRAARGAVEAATGLKLIAQGWRLIVPRWPADRRVPLRLAPLIAVEAVRIVPRDGPAAELDAALWRVEPGDPPLLVADLLHPGPGAAVEIDLTAGFGPDPEAVPEPLRQAVRLIAARWFERRGDEPDSALPPDIAALLAPWRRLRVG